MRETARVQSVASSCRIAGIRVGEVDVVAVLAGVFDQTGSRGARRVRSRHGPIVPSAGPIVTFDELAALNAVVIGKSGNPPPPSVLRETPLHLEVFDAEGRALGRVLQTLPPAPPARQD
jgi:hypothetical protein